MIARSQTFGSAVGQTRAGVNERYGLVTEVARNWSAWCKLPGAVEEGISKDHEGISRLRERSSSELCLLTYSPLLATDSVAPRT
jgi:hypothetical protein